MVKECKVILLNSMVAVVDFGGTRVQFPATKIDGKKVYVEYIDGRYSIASKNDYEKYLNSKVDKKPKRSKATETDLVEEVVELEVVKNETIETSDCPYCS